MPLRGDRPLSERLGLTDWAGLTGLGFGLAMFAALVAIVAVAVGISWKVESRNCAYAAHQYRQPTHYDFSAGCYIHTPTGQSVKLDQYRAVIGR